MKRKGYLLIFILLFVVILLPHISFAQSAAVPASAPAGEVQTGGLRGGLNSSAGMSGLKTDTTLTKAIGKMINTFLLFLGIIFLILAVYAGMVWMTASGDPKNVKTARSILIEAIIGMAVILVSWQIVNYIIDNIKIQ